MVQKGENTVAYVAVASIFLLGVVIGVQFQPAKSPQQSSLLEESPSVEGGTDHEISAKYGMKLKQTLQAHQNADHSHTYYVVVVTSQSISRSNFNELASEWNYSSSLVKHTSYQNRTIEINTDRASLQEIVDSRYVDSIQVRPNEHGAYTNTTTA